MKFFLSSTYEDLKGLRQVAINTLEALCCEVEAMEYFEASTRMNKEVCLRKLKESDLVIGIYGRRYGSIDPETGKSFTEVEFDALAEWDKPFLGFVLDVPEGEREDREVEFINKIFSTGILCAHVNKKKDFVAKLNNSLREYFAGLEGYDYAGIWNEILEAQKLMSRVFGTFIPDGENDVDFALDRLDSIGDDFSEAVKTGDMDAACALEARIKVVVAYLRLNRLKDRLLHEPWSEELRQEVLFARDSYVKTIENYCTKE